MSKITTVYILKRPGALFVSWRLNWIQTEIEIFLCLLNGLPFFVHQVADFLEAMDKGESASPTFKEALATQYVCDAVLASAKDKKWKTVEKA